MIYLTMCDLTKDSPARAHFVGLGNALVPLFQEVDSFTHVNGIGSSIESSDVDFNITTINFPFDHKKRWCRLIALSLFNLSVPFFTLYKLATKRKVHKSVYSRNMPADVVNLIITKLFRAKYIVEINGDVTTDRNLTRKNKVVTFLMAQIQKFSIIYSDHVVVPTENLKSILIDKYKLNETKVVHIENGVCLEKFNSAPRSNLFDEEKRVIIGFAGVFSIWQGLEILVRSAKILSESQLKRIYFVLVGDGPEFHKIKGEVDALGLTEHFCFTGFVPQSDYISLVKEFDICVAPFIKERNDKFGISPIKIHSYLACKKPIITSNISGVREIILKSNGGFLFEPDDPVDLAAKIVFAINNIELSVEKGIHGYDYLSRNFTWPVLAEELYEKIK